MNNKKFLICYALIFLVLGYSAFKIMFPDFQIEKNHPSTDEQYQMETQETRPPEYSIFAYENIPVVYDTDLHLEVQYAISDEDYKLYNEIMDYLNEYFDTSEDVLFEELSHVYGKPADELRQFIMDNSSNAIKRKLHQAASGETISDEQIINCSKMIFNSALKTTVYCSDNPNDWEIDGSGIGYVITTMIGTHPDYLTRDVTINIRFDDYYTSFELTKLKINGVYYYPRD